MNGFLTENKFETIACPLCAADECTTLVHAEDDYGGREGRFQFVTCDDCGLAYQNPRLRFEHIGSWYDEEYIAHRKKTDWGIFTPLYERAMGKHDRDKLALVERYIKTLNGNSNVLDIGCGAGSFLSLVRAKTESTVCGVDFIDLSAAPTLRDVDFRHGRLIEQTFHDQKFDLATMWHFLEHDYEPISTLERTRELLAPGGLVIIEVPRLDSLSFRLFRHRWPGLQAPQHTALYSWNSVERLVQKAGFEVVDHLAWGAFPPYFYLFAGTAFSMLRGRGLNLDRAIFPYFLGQLLTLPVTALHRQLNLAMQTIVCRPV